MCKTGIKQSPIGVRGLVKAKLPSLELNYRGVPLKVPNNGHSIQVDQKGAGSLKFQGQEYHPLQFHFAYPQRAPRHRRDPGNGSAFRPQERAGLTGGGRCDDQARQAK